VQVLVLLGVIPEAVLEAAVLLRDRIVVTLAPVDVRLRLDIAFRDPLHLDFRFFHFCVLYFF